MDAIQLLEKQHREVEKLFKQYQKLEEGSAQERRRLFLAIADNLSAHAQLEEQSFYPAIKTEETEEELREAVEEHLTAKRLIADLLDLTPSDPSFDAKMKVLQEVVEHHVGEEEEELFPQVRKLLAKEVLGQMGRQMQQDFEELMRHQPRRQVPKETDEAAPI